MGRYHLNVRGPKDLRSTTAGRRLSANHWVLQLCISVACVVSRIATLKMESYKKEKNFRAFRVRFMNAEQELYRFVRFIVRKYSLARFSQ